MTFFWRGAAFVTKSSDSRRRGGLFVTKLFLRQPADDARDLVQVLLSELRGRSDPLAQLFLNQIVEPFLAPPQSLQRGVDFGVPRLIPDVIIGAVKLGHIQDFLLP